MQGKVCLVTGASSGIGFETARAFAKAGADVAIVGRDPERSRQAAAKVRAARKGAEVRLYVADLSDLDDVRTVADKFRRDFKRLDVLVNNAAVMTSDRRVTKQGHEATIATNYLAPFVLIGELLPILKKSAPSRIINVTSGLDYRGRLEPPTGEAYEPFQAYSDSKLMLDAYTLELSRRLLGSAVTANLVFPGMVRTRWTRDMGVRGKLVYALMLPVSVGAKRGARPIVRAATDPSLARVSGRYFNKLKDVEAPKPAQDAAAASALWTRTEAMVRAARP